jgi:hypothetical protein
MDNSNFLDPNYVPEEYKVPYDVIELPSQGFLYKNKKSSVKVEFLNAYDENVLSSPNLLNSGKYLDVLLERKVKDLDFNHNELLNGDRLAILLFLRTTGLGNEYTQYVFDSNGKMIEGVIDLSAIKIKKLEIKPDENGEFDFILPSSENKIKFKLLTSKDEDELNEIDKKMLDRNKGVSSMSTLKLERSIMEIDGVRDKMNISHFLKSPKINILDIRKFNKYISDIEPGIDLKTTARTGGGESIECFLRFGTNFWFPEI